MDFALIGGIVTLVVALTCKDGIVMASDTQVTSGTSGGYIGQEGKKLYAGLEGQYKMGNMIVGVAGSWGMIEKELKILSQYAPHINQYGLTEQLQQEIRMRMAEVVSTEKQIWLTAHPEMMMHGGGGMGHGEGFPGAYLMVAVQMPSGEKKIWEIMSDATDQFIENIGKGAQGMGSGDVFALTSLQKYDVRSSTLSEAKVLAYKAIIETEDMKAFGVGGRIDMWVMGKSGSVEHMSKDDMEDISNAYGRLAKGEVDALKSSDMEKHFKHMEDSHKFRRESQVQTMVMPGMLRLQRGARSSQPLAEESATGNSEKKQPRTKDKQV